MQQLSNCDKIKFTNKYSKDINLGINNIFLLETLIKKKY